MNSIWQTLEHADKLATLEINSWNSAITDPIWAFFSDIPVWIPMYVMIVAFIFQRLGWKKGLIVVAAAALTFGFCDQSSNLLKAMTERLRPCNDPFMLHNGLHLLETGGVYGFFSAHAANTFSICVFFSLMMRNAWLTLSLTTWSLINCWTRIYLGMHYPSDILVGLIWGGVSGYIAYYVYKNIKRKTTEQDISDKFRYSQRDILPVTTIIAATLVFAIIYAAI